MLEDMAQVHISEAELAQDLHAVLEKVRQGAEVIVERDHQPLAVLRAPEPRRRTISECIAVVDTSVIIAAERRGQSVAGS